MSEPRNEDLEERLVSSLRTKEDLQLCQRLGVTASTFTSAPDAEVDFVELWRYVEEHASREGGQPPTKEDLQALFGFEQRRAGDLRTYVEKLRQRERSRGLRQLLASAALRLEEGDRLSKEVEEELTLGLAKLRSTGEPKGQASYLDKDVRERWEVFQEAQQLAQKKGIIGIPTGLASFDRTKRGFTPGELVVVVGSTGVGKSWTVLYMIAVAVEHGKKVMLVSPELSKVEQGFRLDSVLGHLRGRTISNEALITGQADKQAYKEWLKNLHEQAEGKVICVDSSSRQGQALSFTDVWRLTLEHSPDMIAIDGLHLLAPDKAATPQKSWEVLKDGTAYLKALAMQERVVVLAAHQAVREAAENKAGAPPSLAQIALGFSVANDADRVIALGRDPGSELHRLYMVPKLRAGKPIVETRRLYFNVDIGEIHEVKWEAEEQHDSGL